MSDSISTSCVYILENKDAQRVKIGATTNDPIARLLDANRKWLGIKGRCQICLNWRLVKSDGRMPTHVLSMNHCSGSNALPLEAETSLAEQELIKLKEQQEVLAGSEKISAIRKFNNLRKVVEIYRTASRRAGEWRILTSYPLSNAYEVEAIAHEMLSSYLDSDAPIGEVFSCSIQEAISAVESAMTQCRK